MYLKWESLAFFEKSSLGKIYPSTAGVPPVRTDSGTPACRERN
jgi:hypothetical protein